MKIQSGMQQSQASMTPLTDKLERMNRVREGVQQTSRSQEQKPNALAEAGRDFVKQNPAPDPKEGVAMSISEMGKRTQEHPRDQVMAQDRDGSVVRKQEAKVQEDKKEEQAAAVKEPAEQPKTPREAVEAVAEKRKEEAAKEAEGSSGQVTQKTPKEAVPEVADNRKEQATEIRTPAREQEEEIKRATPPEPGKNELEDVSLEGTISLKEYQAQKAQQEQQAQRQVAETAGNDVLKVA